MSDAILTNAVLQAGIIASDQVYGATAENFDLQWIDNTATGVAQPLPTPPGWKIVDQTSSRVSADSGIKIVFYKNELTNQIMTAPKRVRDISNFRFPSFSI